MERRQFGKTILSGAAMATLPFGLMDATKPELCKKTKKTPPALKRGDRVALVSPGSPIDKSKLTTAIKHIEHLELIPVHTERVLYKHGYLAGTDQDRLSDLHKHIEDPSIKAIWCIRGGYGTTRILPHLNYHLIKKNPKIFIGYSDITALLQAIQLKTGLISFHGPMALSEFNQYNTGGLRAVLMSNTKGYRYQLPQKFKQGLKILASGTAIGRLAGGNLTLLASMAGTPYAPDLKNKIVFLEDVGEKPYRIDRMLTQLLQSGLADAKGIVLGIFADCQAKKTDQSLSLYDVFVDRLGELNIPVIYGFPFGHIKNQCTLPIGIKAQLDTDKATLRLLESAVEI